MFSKYTPIDKALFEGNRRRLRPWLAAHSCALLSAGTAPHRNGDQAYPFRPLSDFFYLTGIEQPGSFVLVVSQVSAFSPVEILFIERPDSLREIWNGKMLTPEAASAISGIEAVHYTDELPKFIREVSRHADRVYLSGNYVRSGFQLQKESRLIVNRHLSLAGILPLAPLLTRLRLIKSDFEIALIREACSITGQAFRSLAVQCRAGMKEYEAEAKLTAAFLSAGAQGHAFQPIVAAGENAAYLHYTYNNATLAHGDLLLIDFGAEYAWYAADCTRTIPVSGRFSPRQRAVYESVLSVQRRMIPHYVPGTTINDLNRQAKGYMSRELVKLGLVSSDELDDEVRAAAACEKYFMHGVAHFLGLDVHDSGEKDITLEPGMVLTCEPAIYIPAEKIGIRLENDVLVADVPVDLTNDIPIEADEIESIMNL